MEDSSDYFSGRTEGIMIVLQELSLKEGFNRLVTKDYAIQKLTELELTEYIESIVEEYYTEQE